jgi:hypothetical protein
MRWTLSDDRGAMRVVTITKLLVVMVILGVCGYDTFAIMATRVHTEDDAQNAAYAASSTWNSTKNINEAYQSAVAAVAGKPCEKVLTQGFSIDPDGTAHLTVTCTAHTLVVDKIGPLKHWIYAAEHGDSNSQDSA